MTSIIFLRNGVMTYHLAVGVNGGMPNDKCGINQRKRKAMKVGDGATAKRFSSTVLL
jgi:hypothetical protein